MKRGEIIVVVNKSLGLAGENGRPRIKPTVRKVARVYLQGISVTKSARRDIEVRLQRGEGLKLWFMKNVPQFQIG